MLVSEVMHSGVTIAQINDSLKRVAKLMKKQDIGGLPVYKNERPVGFVTDRDIVVACVASGHSPDDPISLAMSRDLVCVHADQEIGEALKVMEQKQISRLLVLDKGDNPVGMLSLRDIALRSDDDHLKAEVLNEIKRS
ncbi:MAG: CBS domain-containing protein [Bdellovibrionales bacterium]|nr:CBS domain-containing protein [Bdellovibrionales bacterium]